MTHEGLQIQQLDEGKIAWRPAQWNRQLKISNTRDKPLKRLTVKTTTKPFSSKQAEVR